MQLLPVPVPKMHQKKGAFFTDPYFADCWNSMDFVSIPSSISAMSSKLMEFEQAEDYKIILDLSSFQPEEILITKDPMSNQVQIEGVQVTQENFKQFHAQIYKQFCRNFVLPSNSDVERLKVNLSSDNMLQLVVPIKYNNDQIGAAVSVHQCQQENTVNPTKCFVQRSHTRNCVHEGSWSKVRRCDPYFHALTTFDMKPSWWGKPNSTGYSDVNGTRSLQVYKDNEKYTVVLDARPLTGTNELKVNKDTKGIITIQGSYEESQDSQHGFISRGFLCLLHVPEELDTSDILIAGGSGKQDLPSWTPINRFTEFGVQRRESKEG